MSTKKILKILLVYTFVVAIALILLDFTLITFVAALAAGVLVAGVAVTYAIGYKKIDRKNCLNLILLILLIWLLPQILMVTNIEIEYSRVKNHYIQEYQEILGNKEQDELNASWNISVLYNNEFERTYSVSTPPSRLIFGYVVHCAPICPIWWLYFKSGESSKLIVVQKKGGCGEFANAVTFLLNDVTGLNTRVVSIEGIDHAFPEVNFKDDWWVFDLHYTTKDYPIEARYFASHLKKKWNRDKYVAVANLKNTNTGETVLAEHGFPPSNLTITAIRDLTGNSSDDKPAINAEVEVFAFQNSYDPLVAKGRTDKFGNYSFILNNGREYLILIKKEKTAPVVGIAKINLSSPNESIVVYLHKYE